MERGCDRTHWPDAYWPGNDCHAQNEPTATDAGSPLMGCDGRTSPESDIADEPQAVILGVVDSSLPLFKAAQMVRVTTWREMSGRFLCGFVWAITCLCGCSDYSSKQQPLEPGSHLAQDDATTPTSLESNPVVQSTVAKGDEPVQAMIRLSRNAIASEDSLQLFIDLRVVPGWHIYAADGDSGPYSPTAFELELPAGVEFAGEWTYPETQTLVGSGILAQVYEGNVSFRADLKVRKSISAETQTIRCRIEYQACNQFRCLQVTTQELKITFNQSAPDTQEN